MARIHDSAANGLSQKLILLITICAKVDWFNAFGGLYLEDGGLG